MQRIIVHCKHVSGWLCTRKGVVEEVQSFFSCELSLTAFSLEWDGLSQASHKHKSLWEEKLWRNFYGFEIQVCHSGMARSGVKPPAKHICITRGLSMRSMLYHGSASCCVF